MQALGEVLIARDGLRSGAKAVGSEVTDNSGSSIGISAQFAALLRERIGEIRGFPRVFRVRLLQILCKSSKRRRLGGALG